jgi:hypothetical protein
MTKRDKVIKMENIGITEYDLWVLAAKRLQRNLFDKTKIISPKQIKRNEHPDSPS